jgi:hypothetical protein
MQNQRRVKRTHIVKSGKIITAHSATAIDCLVCDLTNSGAGLRVAAGETVPDYFELIFDSRLFTRACHVRWRHNGRLGVKFSAA